MKIDSFIVPLYHRIYLEASKAEKLLYSLFEDPSYGITSHWKRKELPLVRFFLTSGRSFKCRLNRDAGMNTTLKALLLSTSFPKFIWIAEISTIPLFKKNKANGIIIIDATGDDTLKSICFLLYPDRLIRVENGCLGDIIPVDFMTFDIYRNNLKGEWCQWEAN